MYRLTANIFGERKSFPLPAGRCWLGRGDDNDVIVQVPSVSRHHVELLVEEDRVVLRDLGSSQGTWVNRTPVLEPTVVRPGDCVRCGRQEFILRLEDGTADGEVQDEPVSEDTPARLSEPGRISSSDRLNREDLAREAIRSETVTHALLMAVTEASSLLTASRPLSDVFKEVLDLVAQVIPARRILLLTLDSPGSEPMVRAVKSAAPCDEWEPLVLSRTIMAAALEEHQSLLLNDVPNDSRFHMVDSIIRQKLRSALVAPLFKEQEVLGILYADHDSASCAYNRDQLRAFTLLARLIAGKIINARLLEAEQEMVRVHEELAMATRVQRSMLPTLIPEIPGYSVAAHQVTCQEVGGDLYDVAQLEDGRVAFVLGDVSGKGIGAALLVSNVVACLRVLYQECLGPCCLAARLHKELLESTAPDYFVTFFFGILDPANHRLDYVNAGHNPPLFFTGDDAPRMLDATGLPLGMLEKTEYEAASVDVPEGSLLCLFSDGIPEARLGSDFYGDERFLESVRCRRDQPVHGVSEGILADLKSYLGDTPPSDDITLFLLRRS